MDEEPPPTPSVWPPPVQRLPETTRKPQPAELTYTEDHIMRGRWLYTVIVGYALIVLAYDLTHHILSRWSLGPLVFIPLAVKGWRLRYRK